MSSQNKIIIADKSRAKPVVCTKADDSIAFLLVAYVCPWVSVICCPSVAGGSHRGSQGLCRLASVAAGRSGSSLSLSSPPIPPLPCIKHRNLAKDRGCNRAP